MRTHPVLTKWIGAVVAVAAILSPLLLAGGAMLVFASAALTAQARLSAWRAVQTEATRGLFAWVSEIANSGAPLKALRFHLDALIARASVAARTLVTSLAGGLRTAMVAARGLTLALLSNPITWVGVAVVGLALLIRKYWQPLAAFFSGFWSGLSTGLAPVGEAFRAAFAPLRLVLQPVLDLLAAAWRWVTDLLAPVEDVGGAAASTGQMVGAAFAAVLRWPGLIIAGFLSLPSRMMDAGLSIARGIADGIRAGWSAIGEAISSVATGIKDAVTGFFAIRSPSRVMSGLGGMISAGLAQGITAGEEGVRRSMRRIVSVPVTVGVLAAGSSAFAAQPVTGGIAAAPGAHSITPSITINVTVNGDANADAIAQRVRREVEAALRERDNRAELARRGRMFD